MTSDWIRCYKALLWKELAEIHLRGNNQKPVGVPTLSAQLSVAVPGVRAVTVSPPGKGLLPRR